MIKEIITNNVELSVKCERVGTNPQDYSHIVEDLQDTAESPGDNCAGLAANQIGYTSRIILVRLKGSFVVMINPVMFPIMSKGRKNDVESCFSFPNKETTVKRYKHIKVSYYSPTLERPIKLLHLQDDEARAPQHEIDHLNGIPI